jgi:hypothetical protein
MAQEIDAGIFVIMLGIAFGSLFFGAITKFGFVFKLVGAIIFLSMAVMMNAEYDVAYTVVTSGGGLDDPIIDKRYIIGDGDDATDNNQNWLGWIFVLLGLTWIGLFFMEMMQQKGFM